MGACRRRVRLGIQLRDRPSAPYRPVILTPSPGRHADKGGHVSTGPDQNAGHGAGVDI